MPAKAGEKDLQYLRFQIQNKYEGFSPAARKVADYLLAHHREAVYMSITQLAQSCGVSSATVTGFVRQVGYAGFRELKIGLARGENSGETAEPVLYGQITLSDPPRMICEKVFKSHIDALHDTLQILDIDALQSLAGRIAKARRIDLYGQSSSAQVAEHFAGRLQRIGIRAMATADPHAQLTSAALLERGDVAIGISNSGRSPEIARALQVASRSGAYTCCVTSSALGTASRSAGICLLTAADASEIIEDLPSRVAETALFDALYLCVAARIRRRAMSRLYKVSTVLDEQKR